MFMDIADNRHDLKEVDQVLLLADNIPLAISLLANLADAEGCSTVLLRWDEEKTSIISDGYDRRSNLELSISLSISSSRVTSIPHALDVLSLLSMLPEGLSDVELVQSKLPVNDILGCRAALIRTTLAYNDEHKRLKLLVPIREYIHKIQPPGDEIVTSLLKYFGELLEFFKASNSRVAQISSNYLNIQNVLRHSLNKGHPDLVDSIYCTCHLNRFSVSIGKGSIPLMDHISPILPQPRDHRLEVYFVTELFNSWETSLISHPEVLIAQTLAAFDKFDDLDVKCMLSN
jgi:hypothetical protein